MQTIRLGKSLVAALALAGAVSATQLWGQVPPPAAPTPTLWSFLGIPQGLRFIRDNTLNRTGNRPGLERKPPLKPIGDPSNLQSENPAIKKAAEIKQAEDQKKQKIKAVKFLAQIGCGCYNRDGGITDALVKAMDDCTEEVRLATVQAITEAAMGEVCVNCKSRSCCSEELTNKLYEIAYERDENGCYLEPSERVRNAAAEALRACCTGAEEFAAPPMPVPRGGERPGTAPPAGGEQPPPSAPQPTPAVPPAAALPGYGPAAEGLVPIRVPFEGGPGVNPPSSAAPRSSRRTSLMPGLRPDADRQVHPLPGLGAEVRSGPRLDARTWLSAGATESRPHWVPGSSTARVTFLPPSRLLPLDAEEAALALPSDLVPVSVAFAGVEPAAPVRTAAENFQRLPPVLGGEARAGRAATAQADGTHLPAGNNFLPLPPLPPAPPLASSVSAPALPVSTKAQMSFLKRNDGSPVETLPTASTPPAVRSAVSPAAAIAPLAAASPSSADSQPRTTRRPLPPLPGAEFGKGSVLSIRPKDNLVVLQFAEGAAVPAGSLVRVYHQYALAGKKAVCDLEVLRGENGIAAAVPREGSSLAQISVGDEAIVLR